MLETRRVINDSAMCYKLLNNKLDVASLFHIALTLQVMANKKAQLSLTNPRDACEKFVRFT